MIAGENEPLSRAIRLVEKRRGMAVPLKVSGAWHSKLMKNAVDEFREFMVNISFAGPQSAILFNATAKGETDPECIKDIMAKLLVCPVKWYDIGLSMLQDGVNNFVEVGPKRVLIGLLKRSVPREKDVKFYSAQNAQGVTEFIEKIKKDAR